MRIVNSVCNDSGVIRRRTAENFVSTGRAVWIGDDQIKLIETHPKNVAARSQAANFVLHAGDARDVVCRDANATTFRGVGGREHDMRRCREFGGLPLPVTARTGKDAFEGRAVLSSAAYDRGSIDPITRRPRGSYSAQNANFSARNQAEKRDAKRESDRGSVLVPQKQTGGGQRG